MSFFKAYPMVPFMQIQSGRTVPLRSCLFSEEGGSEQPLLQSQRGAPEVGGHGPPEQDYSHFRTGLTASLVDTLYWGSKEH